MCLIQGHFYTTDVICTHIHVIHTIAVLLLNNRWFDRIELPLDCIIQGTQENNAKCPTAKLQVNI